VGINSAIYTRSGGSMGIGFAIPVNMVRTVIAAAKLGGRTVRRPWLGASLRNVTADIAESIRLAAPFVQYVHVADSNRKQPGRGHLDFRPGFRALKDAGYQTYMVGKWHLGHADKKFWPQNRGFDHFYGNVMGEVNYFTRERDGVIDWQSVANDDSICSGPSQCPSKTQ